MVEGAVVGAALLLLDCARSYIASDTWWNAVCRRSVLSRMSSASSPLTASLTSLIASSISCLGGGVDLLRELLSCLGAL